MKFWKLSAVLVLIAALSVLSVSAEDVGEAAGEPEISIVETDGGFEVCVKNTGETYLGNVQISAEDENGELLSLTAVSEESDETGTSATENTASAEAVTADASDLSDGDGANDTPDAFYVRSIAPGDEVRLCHTEADDTGLLGDVRFLVAVGAVLIAAILLAVMIFTSKKRGRGASSVTAALLVAALLPLGVGADSPERKTVTARFEMTDSSSVSVSVSYVNVPASEMNPLKNDLPHTKEGEDYNTPAVNIKRIKSGAGPLTTHNIYVGENDFMFYGDAIADYTGDTVIDERHSKKLCDMMNERDSWARENDILLYLVICPDKSSVYSDYVPEKLTPAEETAADTAVKALAENSTVRVIDLRDVLVSAREQYGDNLYYKYDTHWNNNGGYVAYREIMRRINGDIGGAYTLTEDEFDITECETYMKDMAYYLGFYGTFTDSGPVYTLKSGMSAKLLEKKNDGVWGQYRFAYVWSDGYSDAMKYLHYKNYYNESAPSLYVYRDSFSVSLVHFLKDSFNESVFNWTYDFNRSDILESGADVVIIEVVEKNLGEMINSRTFAG